MGDTKRLAKPGTPLLYRALVSVRLSMLEALPGALSFCIIWFGLTFLFGIYLRNFALYNKTYGALGVFLILMLWMYLTSLSLLIGGELNAELHRRREHQRFVEAELAEEAVSDEVEVHREV